MAISITRRGAGCSCPAAERFEAILNTAQQAHGQRRVASPLIAHFRIIVRRMNRCFLMQRTRRDRVFTKGVDAAAHMSLWALASEVRSTQLQVSSAPILIQRQPAVAAAARTDQLTRYPRLGDATAHPHLLSGLLTECIRDIHRCSR